jgi:hypothetical protein
MQREGRAVLYGQNTFEITPDICNEAFYHYFGNVPDALPIHFLQRVMIYIDRTSDILGLFLLVEGCVSLTKLIIVIQSVPEDYAERFASVHYRRPSDLALFGVEIPQARALLEEVQTAHRLLLDTI